MDYESSDLAWISLFLSALALILVLVYVGINSCALQPQSHRSRVIRPIIISPSDHAQGP